MPTAACNPAFEPLAAGSGDRVPCRLGASPGRHQPISLRETVLFEKWSRTLRVCLMADFCAYSPRVAAAGARVFCSGRKKQHGF